MAQTSDKISSLAARYAGYTKLRLAEDASANREQLVADIRSMAASLLRQDGTKGLRGLWRKVTGQ